MYKGMGSNSSNSNSNDKMKYGSDNNFYGKQKSGLPNYDFHSKSLEKQNCVKPNISKHIKNWENYDEIQLKAFFNDLEYDHSFIQWIFPNFFNSMFNSDSYRLTIEERNKMIKDVKVMNLYINNYKMFLKFLGIKWNEKQLELENQKQFHKCLRINTHNQLRLKRVFASLSVLGQREEALKLLELIHKEDNQLYGTEYYLYDHLKVEKFQNKQQVNQETQFENKTNEVKNLKNDSPPKQNKDIDQQKQFINQQEGQKNPNDNQQGMPFELIKNDKQFVEKEKDKQFIEKEKDKQFIEKEKDKQFIEKEKNKQFVEKEKNKQFLEKEKDNQKQIDKQQPQTYDDQKQINKDSFIPQQQQIELNEHTNQKKIQKKTDFEQPQNEQQNNNIEEELKTKKYEEETLKNNINQIIPSENNNKQQLQEQKEVINQQQSQTEQKQIKQNNLGYNESQNKQQTLNKSKEEEDGFIEIKQPKNTNNNLTLTQTDTKVSKQNDQVTISKKYDYQPKQEKDYYSYQYNDQNNSYYSRNPTNYKRPQYVNNKYEKFEDQFNFEEVKNNYVQGDLLNKDWVTVDLLSPVCSQLL